tara:strand:+ start:173 stop:763 length:591 start_codon:yes stop_codon:yes gene_type:complete
MFTGIIEKIGVIQSIEENNNSSVIDIKINDISFSIGESICVNGVCLTVEKITNQTYSFSVSPETNRLTNLKHLKKDSHVNIESSMTINKLISGHIVQGHIDTTSEIIEIEQRDNSWFIKFLINQEYSKYLIKKGSVSIDGVSLTVNDVTNNDFNVMIIPHTYQNTIIKSYTKGSVVNVEIDILAKYIEKLGKANDK